MIDSGYRSYLGIITPSRRDLFTYDEIKEMITLSGLNIEVFPVYRSPNVIGLHRHINRYIPQNSVFWSGNWRDIAIARLYGFRTHKTDRGKNVNGSMIRSMLLQGDGNWERYVNPEVAKLIKEMYDNRPIVTSTTRVANV